MLHMPRRTTSRCGAYVTDLLNTGCTNTATRRVNNAQRSHVIIWIDNPAFEVRHDISDFCAIKEVGAANNLVRNTSSKQHVFEYETGRWCDRRRLCCRTTCPYRAVQLFLGPIHAPSCAHQMPDTPGFSPSPSSVKKALWLAVSMRNNRVGSGKNMAR